MEAMEEHQSSQTMLAYRCLPLNLSVFAFCCDVSCEISGIHGAFKETECQQSSIKRGRGVWTLGCAQITQYLVLNSQYQGVGVVALVIW